MRVDNEHVVLSRQDFHREVSEALNRSETYPEDLLNCRRYVQRLVLAWANSDPDKYRIHLFLKYIPDSFEPREVVEAVEYFGYGAEIQNYKILITLSTI